MKENAQEQEELLETDNGRFLFELRRISNDIEEYMGAAKVNWEIKKKCRAIIDNLKERAKDEVDKENRHLEIVVPYDLARSTLNQLLDILDSENQEQHALYEALKDIILKVRDSAMGWKSKP